MYRYTDFDTAFLAERNAQFRAQVERRIDGSLTEDEFKPLRLMNGLYLQLHAYMLRVAIPYGTLNSAQMRQLAMISERWDKGYGHFTTRQNIQYNWPQLRDVPDMLDALAEVGYTHRQPAIFNLYYWLPRWLEPKVFSKLFGSEASATRFGLHARTVGPELLEMAAEFSLLKTLTGIGTPDLDGLLACVRLPRQAAEKTEVA